MDPSFILDYTKVNENSKFSFIKPKIFSGTTNISVYRDLENYDEKFNSVKYSDMISNKRCKIIIKSPILTIPFDSTNKVNTQLKLSFSKIPFHNNDAEKESFINCIEIFNEKIAKVARTNIEKFVILDRNTNNNTKVMNVNEYTIVVKNVIEKNTKYAYQISLLLKCIIDGVNTRDLFTIIDADNKLSNRTILTKKSYVRSLIILDGITMIKDENKIFVYPKWTVLQIQKVNIITDIYNDLETINYFDLDKPIEKIITTRIANNTNNNINNNSISNSNINSNDKYISGLDTNSSAKKCYNDNIPPPPLLRNDSIIDVKKIKLINGGRPIVTEYLLKDMIGKLKKQNNDVQEVQTLITDN